MNNPELPELTGEVVPFGKYKGQPIEVLFADPSYREWVLAQPWVKDRYATFHQVVINYGGEPQDSPEHNQMQASFLDDGRCFRLAQVLWPRRVWTAGKAVAADRPVVEMLRRFPAHFSYQLAEAAIEDRRFEVDGWDVVYGFVPPYADVDVLTLPGCVCGTCDHSICPDISVCRGGDAKWPCQHRGHEASRNALGSEWVRDVHCAAECPYATDSATELLRARSGFYGPTWRGRVRVECKPDLGDDFPTVLRQVLRFPRDSFDRVCVVVRRHGFQSVTWGQVEAMFAASDITLVREADLDRPSLER